MWEWVKILQEKKRMPAISPFPTSFIPNPKLWASFTWFSSSTLNFEASNILCCGKYLTFYHIIPNFYWRGLSKTLWEREKIAFFSSIGRRSASLCHGTLSVVCVSVCPSVCALTLCFKHVLWNYLSDFDRVPRGLVVRCYTRNPGVLSSSRTRSSGFFRGSVLGQDTSEPSLVLVKPRKAWIMWAVAVIWLK